MENQANAQSEVLIMPGGAIKARGKEIKNGVEIGKVGGVLCRFTNKNETDWYGDFFDEDTDFRFTEGMLCPVYFDHACNGLIGVRVFGIGVLTRTAEGIEIEAEIELTDDDAKALYKSVEAGELGWSSGTAGHLVKRTQVKTWALHGDTAYRIEHWPLGLDASLTPWPAEPKNVATIKSIKSYSEGRQKPVDAVKHDAVKMAEIAAIEREAIMLQADLILLSVR